MKVVILCGGMGTRMKEETEIRPKPMVEVGGKPILWHIMKIYSHYGFNEFVLALGYKGEFIKQYFYQYRITCNDFTVSLDAKRPVKVYGSSEENDWEITCVDTGMSTLKGGRIKRLEPFLDGEAFHLTYGDAVADIDIGRLVDFHRQHGALGTVTGVRPPSRFGEMEMEGDCVIKFEEKPQMTGGKINGGFFILNREILNYLTADEDCDLEFGALQRLSEERQLRAFRHEGFWQCMDNVRERDYLNELWKSGEAPWKIWEA